MRDPEPARNPSKPAVIFRDSLVYNLQSIEREAKELLQFEDLAFSSGNFDLWHRVLVQRLTNIATTARECATNTVISGVRRNALSRKLASELLGVHQGTVARWVNNTEHPESWHLDHRSEDKLAADERIDDD